ncbi:MAG: response regulator [Lachnospiraceae bacterium]|nr:response regulator [Lachnospiraceae bacterium]
MIMTENDRLRIIVVDDERLQLETNVEYLSEIYPQAEIRPFEVPGQALEDLMREDADLVLLETLLPGRVNGIQLAVQCRRIRPHIRILFCTDSKDYAVDAFKIHADRYLCKPVMKNDLKNEIEYIFESQEELDQPSDVDIKSDPFAPDKPYLRTFGSFELFSNGEPVVIRRKKSKEILALLTDRRGGWMTNAELAEVFWKGEEYDVNKAKYVSTLVKELMLDLKRAGISDIVERRRGRIRLCVDQVNCDYYRLPDRGIAVNSHSGSYMEQYNWGKGRGKAG